MSRDPLGEFAGSFYKYSAPITMTIRRYRDVIIRQSRGSFVSTARGVPDRFYSVEEYQYVWNIPSNAIDAVGLACGSAGNDWIVPDVFFEGCCQDHDDCYGKCSGPKKETCDNNFLDCMVQQCEKIGVEDRWYPACIFLAGTYYRAVEVGGGGAFNNARKDCCPNSPPSGCPKGTYLCYTGCPFKLFKCIPIDQPCVPMTTLECLGLATP